MNKDLWLTPVSADLPCGEDLEYDDEFLALDTATQGKAEQQYGDTVIPAEDPDWREVEKRAESLLKRTQDLRVIAHLTRACTANNGLPGLAAGLSAIHTLLDNQWDNVHPRLIIDDDEDPFVRINALSSLAAREGLLRTIRQAMLVKSAVGPILIKDAEAALDNAPNPAKLSRDQVLVICADAQAAGQPALTALHEAFSSTRSIITLCDERFGGEYSPDLVALKNLLGTLVKAVGSTTTESAENENSDSASLESAGADTGSQKSTGLSGIRSREDAIKALDLVCRYIEKNEPTNPAPLLIRRAQKLMSLGFMDIIKELAPDGMKQIEVITGIKRE